MKKPKKVTTSSKISSYKVALLVEKLKTYKSLSIIFLDLSSFESMQQKYGQETFKNIHKFIKKNLTEASGSQNFFRKTDTLLQDKNQKNHFYIVLSSSRENAPILKPGELERISLRIEKNLEKKLWEALESKKILPSSLKTIPHIPVGHSSVVSSLGKEFKQSAHELVDSAKKRALLRVEERRINDKEILQYVIANEGILEPYYQGIFFSNKLDSIYPEDIKKNKQALFAFESLIRINQKFFKEEFKKEEAGFLNLKYVSPDILFDMAKKTGLELELDFKCILEAIKKRPAQKSILFINILPRNFYIIEKIQKSCPKNLSVYFEISETEAIENFSLVKKLRAKIKKYNFFLAIDDFGQGHSNFARVLGLKPDLIKLDRIFIEDIHKNTLKQNLVKAIRQSLVSSDIQLLAEGVETKEELNWLKSIGIPLVQGYLTHRPSPSCEITENKNSLQKKKDRSSLKKLKTGTQRRLMK